jgi:hypothetical protein
VEREEGEIQEDQLMARLELMSGIDDNHQMFDGSNCDWDVSAVTPPVCQLSASDVDKLSLPVLQAILSDWSLVVQSEHSIFEIVHRRRRFVGRQSLSDFALLEFVRFEFVSDECVQRAWEFISNSFDLLKFGIWSSLRSRFTLAGPHTSQMNRFSLVKSPYPELIRESVRQLQKSSPFSESKHSDGCIEGRMMDLRALLFMVGPMDIRIPSH